MAPKKTVRTTANTAGPGGTRVTQNETTNVYLRKLQDSCDICLRNVDNCVKVLKDHGNSGVFNMFLSRAFFKCLRKWTNIKVNSMRTTQATVKLKEIYVYMGILLYMSYVRLPTLKEY